MNADGAQTSTVEAAETLLRAELARGDVVLASIGPVLRHLVTNDDQSVFSEEIVARTRALMASLAVRLQRDAQLAARQEPAPDAAVQDLIELLVGQPALLAHCHALALEGQLTERLAARAQIDPTLVPLLAARLAAPEPDDAALAMKVLAAQTRFVQAQRRMEVAPEELPADLLHGVLVAFDGVCGAGAGAAAGTIRAGYDEARSRLGLLNRLVLGLGAQQPAALTIDTAGLAIFSTALSLAAMQAREQVVLAMAEGQQARLAAMLAAAGQGPAQVEATLALVHPDSEVPRHYLGLARERAEALLAGGDRS